MEPRPSLEWQITTKCNYTCAYCRPGMTNSKKYGKHCSEAVSEAVCRFISQLPGAWFIKLIGGEPMIHPRIFSIVDTIAQRQHQFAFTTNFSLPIDMYKKLAEKLGEKLEFLGASLHLSQVKSLDDFIQKAVDFNKLKHPKTDFLVATVFFEEQFPMYQKMAEQLDRAGIRLDLQHYRVNRRFYKYKNPEAVAFLDFRTPTNLKKIRDYNFLGTLCHTGSLFFNIDIQGRVRRCYDPQILYWLGDLQKGNFKPLSKPMPCLSHRCTCPVPVNRGMILFGQKANFTQMIQACYEGIKRGCSSFL
jgi:organic radical activating enzyme